MIGIVGGGASGLLLLHELRASGADAILFESSAICGGVMVSQAVEGPRGRVFVDLGPQRMRLTAAWTELVDELDLRDELVFAEEGLPFTMLRSGVFHPAPSSLGEAFRTDLISWAGKARALLDLLTPPPHPTETVESALSRKLGPEIYAYLAGPVMGGLYASHPSRMRAADTLIPAFRRTGAKRSLLRGLLRVGSWERRPVVSFREGMGQLARSLASRHHDQIRVETPVEGLDRLDDGRFRLHIEDESFEVDQVVLTLPGPAAGELLRGLDAPLAEGLSGLRYNPLAVVPLVVEPGAIAPSVGSGYKVPLSDASITRGVTSHDGLFGRDGLFTAFLGGMGFEDVASHTDGALMDMARSDFARATGVRAIPLLAHRTAMPAWDETWDGIRGRTPPRGIHLCGAFSGRPGLSGRLEETKRLAARLLEATPT